MVLKTGVHMWGYAYATDVFPYNAYGMYFEIVPQFCIHFAGLEAFYAKAGNGTTVFGFQRGMDFSALAGKKPPTPLSPSSQWPPKVYQGPPPLLVHACGYVCYHQRLQAFSGSSVTGLATARELRLLTPRNGATFGISGKRNPKPPPLCVITNGSKAFSGSSVTGLATARELRLLTPRNGATFGISGKRNPKPPPLCVITNGSSSAAGSSVAGLAAEQDLRVITPRNGEHYPKEKKFGLNRGNQ